MKEKSKENLAEVGFEPMTSKCYFAFGKKLT